jgi:hypothetical protein
MTGRDAAPLEHRDVRTQGLQGCAGIAAFPEGHCFERSRGASGGTHTDVCAAWPWMAMQGLGVLGKRAIRLRRPLFAGADELRITRDRLRLPSCRWRQSFKSTVAVNCFADLPFVADHLLFHRHRFWRWPLCVRFITIDGPRVSRLAYLLIIGFQRQRISVLGHAKILERVHADQDFIQVRIDLGIQIPHRDIADFEAVDLRKMVRDLAAGGV